MVYKYLMENNIIQNFAKLLYDNEDDDIELIGIREIIGFMLSELFNTEAPLEWTKVSVNY